jgi:serine/threonine protein kinase
MSRKPTVATVPPNCADRLESTDDAFDFDQQQRFNEGMDYKSGDVIGGKYEVHRVLGKGGFGVVYAVLIPYEPIPEMYYLRALKTFRDELFANSAAQEAFRNEAVLWVNLEEHPNILSAKKVVHVSNRLFVEMEYISPDKNGCVNLADYLGNKNASYIDVLPWAIQFCLGMEHARSHGLICHRDIKPANILINPLGIKIADFGLSVAAEAAWRASRLDGLLASVGDNGETGFSIMQADGKVMSGTPGYIAPEVYRYEGADTRSDIYSFGLVLWQMATDRHTPPFMTAWRGDMNAFLREIYEQQMANRLPPVEGPLWPVIQRCLKPDPTERYQDFSEIRSVLQPIWESQSGKKYDVPKVGEKSPDFWVEKGDSLRTLRQHKEAIACYDKALSIDPNLNGAWTHKGFAFHNLNQHEEAIECFDKALGIYPKGWRAYHWKGKSLAALGRHREAMVCYNTALAGDPTYNWCWFDKALLEDSIKQIPDAIKSYRNFLKFASKDSQKYITHAVKRVKELTGQR